MSAEAIFKELLRDRLGIDVESGLRQVASWRITCAEISRAAGARQLPEAPVDLMQLVGAEQPFEVTPWQSLCLTILRGQAKGCRFVLSPRVAEAAYDLMMFRDAVAK